MEKALKLRELAHPAGAPALLAVLLGRAIGRSSARSERFWVRAISALVLRSKRVRNVTLDNLRTCFPDKPSTEIEALAERATREVARSIVETFKVWFPARNKVEVYTDVKYAGLEHFERALDEERGILLLNCHFGSLDLNGSLFRRLDRRGRRLIGVYRKPSNRYVDSVIRYGRSHIVDQAIPINETRAIVAELRAGSIVWLAPDIEASGRRSAFASFFGVPASTSTWPSRLAAVTGALVLPTRHVRLSDKSEYLYEFLAPFQEFPSGNDASDARRFNEFVEGVIMQKPEMYWWCIKRFKHRPDPTNEEIRG